LIEWQALFTYYKTGQKNSEIKAKTFLINATCAKVARGKIVEKKKRKKEKKTTTEQKKRDVIVTVAATPELRLGSRDK
jgi:hypothetical protein